MPLSTRHKILDQWKAAVKACENMRYHMLYIDMLAEGESPHITKNMPAVLIAIDAMHDVLVAYRDGL